MYASWLSEHLQCSSVALSLCIVALCRLQLCKAGISAYPLEVAFDISYSLTSLQCVLPAFAPRWSKIPLFLNAGVSPNPLKTVAGTLLIWGAVWWLLYRMACIRDGGIVVDATMLA